MAHLDNGAIAELLTREAEQATGHLEMAYRRAARAAFLWTEEASSLKNAGRSLTELAGIGPSLARRIHEWIESVPEADPPPTRDEFLTLAKARMVLVRHAKWRSRLNGDLQMHTRWSDGSGSIAEMAAAAIERGYKYIAITDHTQSLKIAGGLDEKRLAQQGKEIASLNAGFRRQGVPFTVLRSAEVNLSPTGEADMKGASLAKLDVVLGCFHSALRRSDDQTERYLAALRNPHIQILGHPQTRVYNHRAGLRADWSRVFAETARLDKAVEIDGYADRQDLRLSLVKLAKKEGARISLGTDAHHPHQLAFMDLSLAAACLAKIPADRIVNFLSASEIQAWVSKVRNSERLKPLSALTHRGSLD